MFNDWIHGHFSPSDGHVSYLDFPRRLEAKTLPRDHIGTPAHRLSSQ